MALPAGRYGVTKNQLLKIKKLPMNTMKLIEELAEKYDLLGTAAFKNSTSVVTQSTDLVESGAVKDIVGWGNKNRVSLNEYTFVKNSTRVTTSLIEMPLLQTGDKIKVQLKLQNVSGVTTGEENSTFFARVGSAHAYTTLVYFNTANTDTQIKELTLSENVPSLNEQKLYIGIANSATGNPSMTAVDIMVSKDGGEYEPYHASVADSLAEKTDNTVIAPTENGSTASQAYAVGSHFIRDGAFCTVTTAISSGESLVGSSKFTSGDVADSLEAVDVTNEFTFSQNFTWNNDWTKIYRIGNKIKGYLRFTAPSAISGSAIITIPGKYASSKMANIFLAPLYESWTGIPKGCICVSSSYIYLPDYSGLANASVITEFEYLL